jgi:hypothetical protein
MSIDRRDFLFLAGAAGAGRSHASAPPPCVGNDFPQFPPGAFRFDSVPDFQLGQFHPNPPKRPLWSKLSDPEKGSLAKELKRAYTRMMNRPSANRKSYLFQAWTHAWYCGGNDPFFGDIHNTWAFLLWHRAFLYLHERLIQAELGDPDFRLPVWDWETDPNVPWVYNSLPWVKHIHCDCPRKQNYICPVTQGQIAAWFGGSCFDSVVGGLTYPGTAFGSLHQCVHKQLGGCMGDFVSAALDPVFYAHHANVDRFLDAWQTQNPGSYTKWPTSCFYFYDRGRPVRVHVQDLHRTLSLGYEYDLPCIPKSEAVQAAIVDGLVRLDDCATQRLSKLLRLNLGSGLAGPATERVPSLAVQFRASVPTEHGRYYIFGMQGTQDRSSWSVAMDPCAGLIGMHRSPAEAVIAADLDLDGRLLLDALRQGIQLVYGQSSKPGDPVCNGAPIANPRPFTPESFEIRVATVGS